MTTPAQPLYSIIDDYAGSTNSAGGGTGNVLAQFTSPTLASAQAVAQIYATLFQRSVRLAAFTGSPPYTPLFVANATSLALSSAPSGIAF